MLVEVSTKDFIKSLKETVRKVLFKLIGDVFRVVSVLVSWTHGLKLLREITANLSFVHILDSWTIPFALHLTTNRIVFHPASRM